jgi:raffinose/stachyose/melibiose transport system substrate-binding protein
MKKWLHVSLSLVLASSVAIGCSNTDSNGGAKDAEAKDSGAKDAGKTVTVTFWDSTDHDVSNKPILADFEKEYPNIKVKLTTHGGFDYEQSLKVAASSGTLPDMWNHQAYMAKGFYYSENGLALDLTAHAKANGWDQKYTKTSMDMVTYNNKMVGVPVRNLATGLFYNKTVFKNLNIQPPKTFAELEDALGKIRAAGILPFSSGGKGARVTKRFYDYLLEHYAGSALHDKLFRTEASWNDPAVVKAFEKMKEWADKEYFAKGFLQSAPTENVPLFYQGKAAITLDGSWFDGQNILADQQDMNNFGLFAFPTDQKPLRINSFIEMQQINAKSPKEVQEAAIKLAEYMSSKEVTTKHAEALGGPVAAIGAKASEKTPHVTEFAELLKEGSYIFELPADVDAIFTQALEKTILAQTTPKQAAEFMEENIKQYKARNK